MKKISIFCVLFSVLLLGASRTYAAAGIFVSGGGTKTAGSTFTVTVAASGVEFDSLQGVISISGGVSVVSFSAGGATWLPGKSPGNGNQFVGIVEPRSSFTVATIKLKAGSSGTGTVATSGVKLARNGTVVGTGTGSISINITKAADLPGNVTVSSSTHPDPNSSYEAATVILSWDKQNGVDGFSYLFDQAPDTTPESKIIDAATTATYADKAVGAYYFHIKAHKTDGWSGVTHFKINIKEPEPRIDASLSKPSNLNVDLAPNAVNNVENGTVTGLRISGISLADYIANIILNPAITIPDGKTLSSKAGKDGKFVQTLDYPVKAGFYILTAQGQKGKTLTPVSDSLKFELSVKNGGSVNIITAADNTASQNTGVKQSQNQADWFGAHRTLIIAVASIAFVLILALAIILFRRRRKTKPALLNIPQYGTVLSPPKQLVGDQSSINFSSPDTDTNPLAKGKPFKVADELKTIDDIPTGSDIITPSDNIPNITFDVPPQSAKSEVKATPPGHEFIPDSDIAMNVPESKSSLELPTGENLSNRSHDLDSDIVPNIPESLNRQAPFDTGKGPNIIENMPQASDKPVQNDTTQGNVEVSLSRQPESPKNIENVENNATPDI